MLMEINRIICVICNGNLKHIYSIENTPIMLSSVENKQKFIYSNMSFSQCCLCNTIQLDKLIPLEILYSNSHNYNSVGETWKGYFQLFNEKISKILKDKNILEIGCPSGKIALSHNDYNKWYIVEPNKNKSIDFNEKIIFIESFFDDKFKIKDKIDIIIHSHLFEHIYDPNIFLKKCYEILEENGEMIFGVPDMQHISENKLSLFLGIFFEHTIFLNKDNIVFLLQKNGFDIIDIIDYKNHSTIYHVKKSKIINSISFVTVYNYYETFMSSINVFLNNIKYFNSIIENTNKNIYIFGASYNTQLLLTIGLNKNKINGILDNCKDKQCKYLYGYNIIITNPEIIKDNDSIVILHNGYYSNEIREQLKKINSITEIIEFDNMMYESLF
jgi:SAM-dependent methyltransferase